MPHFRPHREHVSGSMPNSSFVGGLSVGQGFPFGMRLMSIHHFHDNLGSIGMNLYAPSPSRIPNTRCHFHSEPDHHVQGLQDRLPEPPENLPIG